MKTMAYFKHALIGFAAAAAVFGAGAVSAVAQPGSGKTAQQCFFITQWQGWSAPAPDEILLKVNLHDIYRVDLSAPSPMLQSPGVHLVNRVEGGSDDVCLPIDLQLDVADGHGYREPLIARSLTKLTPDEVAAIPPKYMP
jgi:hypothetical protein